MAYIDAFTYRMEESATVISFVSKLTTSKFFFLIIGVIYLTKNYSKHLDSHLKPYRCKRPGCAEHRYSSIACLLRHEREAHGMHMHMELFCPIGDCERSSPGRGFPRKWNLQDHLKRVHDTAAVSSDAKSDVVYHIDDDNVDVDDGDPEMEHDFVDTKPIQGSVGKILLGGLSQDDIETRS